MESDLKWLTGIEINHPCVLVFTVSLREPVTGLIKFYC